ncbi:MAG TPA: hypothetical protein VII32_18230 [Thermoanaerobaculia bacterium]
MRKLAICVFALALSTQAWALNTDDLLATIAMPLAVNAVSNVTGVSESRLADLVVALNQANVPPTQFVQVIRYTPVALDQPQFVQYVQTQSSQGVTGDALVNAIVEQLRTQYNVTPTLEFNGEPTTFVVSQSYIPQTTLVTTDPFSVIALPLAVAAVSNVTGVSVDELGNFVATLNNANVPPTQIVEVLRYVPVALTTENAPQFVQFVQQQTTQGVTGPALVPVVVQQLQTFYPAQTQIVVTEPVRIRRFRAVPQTVIVDQNFVPAVVVARMKEHPHGGPPGQLKKQLGLQTGAEVVHGEKRARSVVVVPQQQAPVVLEPRKEKEHDHKAQQAPMISSVPPPAPAPVVVAPAGGKGKDNGNQGDQGKGGGKGKGKGHGKD